MFEPVPSDPALLRVVPDFGKRYFPSGRFFPKAPQDFLRSKKADDTYRIIVMGGSSARGYPYDYNGSFSSIMRQLLKQTLPQMKVEVANLAMVAVNSYAVLDLAEKIIPYQPDLVLIYAGHNEFYGALGSGSVESLGRQRWLVKTHLKLENLRIYQFIRAAIFKAASILRSSEDSVSDNSTLMEQMAAKKQIPYGSPLFEKTYRIFAENIRETVQVLNDHNIKVAVATVTSNIMDQKPFLSVFKNKKSEKDWQQFIKESALPTKPLKTEISGHLDTFIGENPLAAAPLYYKGQWLLENGKVSEAGAALFKAKDLDALRFRAAETANSILKNICRETPAILVDVAQSYCSYSPTGIPGNNLFLEHLHPNLFGYYLMAKTFYNTLVDSGWLPQPVRPLPADSLYKELAGVTDFDEEVGAIRIQVLKSGWPFQNRAAGKLSQIQINPDNPVAKTALQFWRNEITWEEAHVKLGRYYLKKGNLKKAAGEFEALRRFSPFNPSPYLELLKIYTPLQAWQELENTARELLTLQENPLAYRSIGLACYATGRPEMAEVSLEKAKNLAPEDLITRFYLAATRLVLSKIEAAREDVDFIRSRNPHLMGLAELQSKIEAAERKKQN
ncbi:MAG: hypothetical protein Kow0037_10010 [Calditrichia bacterium]